MENPTPQLPASQALMALIFDAVEEAMEMLRYPQGLVPFVLFHTSEGRVLRRFHGERNTNAIEKARVAIQQETHDTRGYALIYEATMDYNGTEADVLIIEGGERQQTHGIRFAQRYTRPEGHTIPALAQGHIAYLGQIDLYFS